MLRADALRAPLACSAHLLGVLLCTLFACVPEARPAPLPTSSTSQRSPVTEGRRHQPVRSVRPHELADHDEPARKWPQPEAALPAELTRPARPRIVALGDLHGDLEASRQALRLAGAIDASDHWSGGDLTLVQVGDVLDRGDDDRALQDWLVRLRAEAAQAGGELILLSGNHELMNTMLTFGYVTAGGLAAFGGHDGRVEAFRPGGPYARLLAAQPIVVKVGDTVFAHGGVLPEHITYGLARMNDEIQAFMRGELAQLPPELLDENGLLWTRLYSSVGDTPACEELNRALTRLDARRMVVAHTPQLDGISSGCDGRVLRIDTGMSRFYGGPIEVLEIVLQGDQVRVRRADGSFAPPRQVH